MTDYNALKATELKDLLKERGIPSTGLTRKQQYIEALEAQDAQSGDDTPTQAGDDVQPTNDTADNGNGDDATPNGAEDAPVDEPAAPAQVVDAPEDNNNLAVEDPATQTITPQATSPAPGNQSDSLKRKRRSPTPPVTEESIQKKLKSANSEELATLPGDVKQDAPVPVEGGADETVQPTGVSDDAMDVTGQAQVQTAEIEKAAQDTAAALQDRQPSTEPMAVDAAAADDSGPPATHPPTSALYVRNLLRPLQIPPFRDHLLQLATPPTEPTDDSLITTLHLDTFKSHAFILFSSTPAAIRARAGLHDRIWPEETQRKPLWVDFVPPASAQAWIDAELDAGKSKRFEVVYTEDPQTGATVASLEEVSQTNPTPAHTTAAESSTTPLPGPGMPNAPTGPRGDRSAPAPSTSTSIGPRKPPHSPSLLSSFPSTLAKPKIFYKPVSPALVDKRLDELDRETSRDWDNGRQKPLGSALDQLRRYTFEDGDVVVDGGVDFGGFGRDRGAGGGAGHGHGGFGGRRRGGGGYGGGGRRGGR